MPDKIRALFDQYDRSLIEWCDGNTRICHTILLRENIPHVCMIGVCCYGGDKRLPVHLWIDLKEDLESYRVDYSARRWLGYDPKGTKIITSCLLEP